MLYVRLFTYTKRGKPFLSFVNIQKVLPKTRTWIIKAVIALKASMPDDLQGQRYRNSKGVLLQAERSRFTMRKTVFCIVKGNVRKIRLSSVKSN